MMFYFLGWVGSVREFVKSSILSHMPKIFHIFFFKLGKTKGRGEHHHRTMLWSPAEMLSQFRQPGKGYKPRDCELGSLGPGTGVPLVTSQSLTVSNLNMGKSKGPASMETW